MPNKAVAAAVGAGGGTGFGGAIATLIIALFWPLATPDIVAAITTLCSGIVGIAGAFVSAYMIPHNPANP